ncbi:hypothetical protein CONPUDRAFT_121621 [Coniophora puteana RWD-64-598 SS2]|uniref:Uncharacterized protein n=1 Tax=Coniophora puteana (strain RWD-64-598) TaxID=741705 RepID=A0A5M3MVK5_CONPW|nr:uncharacterized protein CONPUDRAFT_121621 [Coniophora puteana RWD-64-598 SS2]EIW83166.1 hypothetical protein CONPUDRAFT_121621 [Coniophora puteana RWD-64-598 SS2]
MLLPLPLLCALFPLVLAGSMGLGGNCSVSNNRLLLGNNQFHSDCHDSLYCDGTSNTCKSRGCRRDQYPLGYGKSEEDLPPLCEKGQFCPDEGDVCQSQLNVGSPCQLNRDDQCEPPEGSTELWDRFYGRNIHGAICLNYVCTWANLTAGDSCQVDNTAYIAYAGNDEYLDVVSRDDCMIGNYCDAQQLKCIPQKDIGQSCSADKECSTYNCNGVCAGSTDSPNVVKFWVYVVIAVFILGGMISTLVGLYLLHRRQREDAREKRWQYWNEQRSLRRHILQMCENAQMATSALDETSKGTMSEISHRRTESRGHRPTVSDDIVDMYSATAYRSSYPRP